MNIALMGKILMGFIAFVGAYIAIFNAFWNFYKDARSKLVAHYKFYRSDALHATTKKVVLFIEERVIVFPKEANEGIRVDAKIMPYIIEDLKLYKRAVLVLNIMTLGIFRYFS